MFSWHFSKHDNVDFRIICYLKAFDYGSYTGIRDGYTEHNHQAIVLLKEQNSSVRDFHFFNLQLLTCRSASTAIVYFVLTFSLCLKMLHSCLLRKISTTELSDCIWYVHHLSSEVLLTCFISFFFLIGFFFFNCIHLVNSKFLK